MSEQKATQVGPSKIDIVYEKLGDPNDPPVFLIMGGGSQLVAWPDGLCKELLIRGLHLIRFDNRDSGLSTHFNDGPLPDFKEAMAGDFSKVPYSLSDMAADTVGLMDVLGFDSVHLVGASMGGMIAQTIAIEYPKRVRSLTSMMTTTGAAGVGQPDFTILAKLGPSPEDKAGHIEWLIRSLKAIGSADYAFDEEGARDRASRAWDRDHDPNVMLRQAVASLKSGDRTEKLRSVNVPTLVIHGDADKMVDVSGGEATAAAIPGAKLVVIKGMGHGFPPALFTKFADLISDLVHHNEN
ncbi:MAG: alpha/beta hydrolase [Bacteroidetes bacterium]|nr:MAG: alpha/beta hydrolase [Bacteroidota bacterium]